MHDNFFVFNIKIYYIAITFKSTANNVKATDITCVHILSL